MAKLPEDRRITKDALKATLEKRLAVGNVLLVGSPKTGKTRALREQFSADPDTLLVTTDASSTDPEAAPRMVDFLASETPALIARRDWLRVILDDGFTILQGGASATWLHPLLARQKGVCVCTTPYRAQWLLKDLRLAGFQPLFYEVEETRAARHFNETVTPHSQSGVPASDPTIEKGFLRLSQVEWKLDKAWEKSVRGKEYATLAPFWLGEGLTEGEGAARAAGSEILKEIEREAAASAFHGTAEVLSKESVEKIKEALKGFQLQLEPLGEAAASVLTYVPLAGVSLGLYMVIRKIRKRHKEGGTDVEHLRSLEALRRAPPHVVEELERRGGVPPLTFFAMREALSGQAAASLATFVERHSKELEKLDAKLASEEARLKRVEDTVETIEKGLSEVPLISAVFKAAADKAVWPIDDLGKELRQRTKGLSTQDKLLVVGREKEIDDIVQAFESGKRLVVVSGRPHEGKTTVCYAAAKKLQEAGHFVGGYDLTRDPGWLDAKLAMLPRGMQRFIVTKFDATNTTGPTNMAHLGAILDLAAAGQLTGIVFECRPEQRAQLDETRYKWADNEARKRLLETSRVDVRLDPAPESALREAVRALAPGGNEVPSAGLDAILAASHENFGDVLVNLGEYLAGRPVSDDVFNSRADQLREALDPKAERALGIVATSPGISKESLSKVGRFDNAGDFSQLSEYFDARLKADGQYALFIDALALAVFRRIVRVACEKAAACPEDAERIVLDALQVDKLLRCPEKLDGLVSSLISLSANLKRGGPVPRRSFEEIHTSASVVAKRLAKAAEEQGVGSGDGITLQEYFTNIVTLVGRGVPVGPKSLNWKALEEGSTSAPTYFGAYSRELLTVIAARALAVGIITEDASTQDFNEMIRHTLIRVDPTNENALHTNFYALAAREIAVSPGLSTHSTEKFIRTVDTLASQHFDAFDAAGRDEARANYYAMAIGAVVGSDELSEEARRGFVHLIDALARQDLDPDGKNAMLSHLDYYMGSIMIVTESRALDEEAKERFVRVIDALARRHFNTSAPAGEHETDADFYVRTVKAVATVAELGEDSRKKFVRLIHSLACRHFDTSGFTGNINDYASVILSPIVLMCFSEEERSDLLRRMDGLARDLGNTFDPTGEKGALTNYYTSMIARIAADAGLSEETKARNIERMDALARNHFKTFDPHAEKATCTNYYAITITNIAVELSLDEDARARLIERIAHLGVAVSHTPEALGFALARMVAVGVSSPALGEAVLAAGGDPLPHVRVAISCVDAHLVDRACAVLDDLKLLIGETASHVPAVARELERARARHGCS